MGVHIATVAPAVSGATTIGCNLRPPRIIASILILRNGVDIENTSVSWVVPEIASSCCDT